MNSPPAAPISIGVFPARDFVSGSGYDPADRVVVSVIHPNGVTWGTNPAAPLAPINGLIDINHPGAACWFGTTPDIRPGDRVRYEVVAGPNAGRIDEAFVGDVTARRPVQIRPGTVVVHGTATNEQGGPLPLGALDLILVSTTDLFARGRTIKAPGDGNLVYDAPGAVTWTATFTGLSAADVAIALSAEVGISWNGRDGAATEITTYEVGAGIFPGPQAPCRTAFEILPPPPGFETIPPTVPTGLVATVANANHVTLRWTPSTDNVGVTSYGVYRDGNVVANVTRADGLPPAPTTVVDPNVPAGTHVYTIDAADSVGNRSAMSASVSVVTLLGPPPAIAVNEPPIAPIDITVFPSRDLIVTSGYQATDRVDVQVIRDNLLIATVTDLVPVAGMVEINHVGAYCWPGMTPEIRSGDLIRTLARFPNGLIRIANQARVSGMTPRHPLVVQQDDPLTPAFDGIVEVHGSGVGLDGQPIPIEQMSVRLFALRWSFASARHWIRAESVPGGEGLITYDTANNPLGVNWTATFPNLSDDDITAIMGGMLSSGIAIEPAAVEARWNGRVPAALTELTITEVAIADPPGPAPGACFSSFEPADVIAPTTPGVFQVAHAGLDSVLVTWSPSTDDWSVSHYLLMRDGQPYRNLPAAATSFLDSNVPTGLHTYQLMAVDRASPRGPGFDQSEQLMAGWGELYGNRSLPTAIASYNQFDSLRPSTPLNLVGLAGAGLIRLSWSASSDNMGVAGYRVYRDGVALADLPATDTTYADNAPVLAAHSYTVDAVDVAGNRSGLSAPILVRNTAIADGLPPTTPGSFAVTVAPDLHGRTAVLSWTASTDNVGVAGYAVYRNGARIASLNDLTLGYRDSALATGTYGYRVDAYDSGGNRSVLTASLTAVIANSPPVAGHSIQVAPSRDMVTITGYPALAGPYTIQVIRNGAVVGTSTGSTDATGRLDVNLVTTGRACWTTSTPDIRWEDIVRVTNAAGIAEQTQVARVWATRVMAIDSTSVMIRGNAQDMAGLPLPIDQLECRIASNSGVFVKTGVRTLRAGLGGDGTLTYDAPGSTAWTARFTGLTLADMNNIFGGTVAGRAVRPSDVLGLWLGRQPLAGVEASVYEVGPTAVGGPATPTCAAPRQLPAAIAGVTPVSLAFTNTPALPPTVSATQRVTLVNSGNLSLTVRKISFAGWHPNDWTVVAGTFPAVVPAGGRYAIDVAFAPKALGARSALMCVSTDAANSPDHTVTLTGTGFDGTLAGVPGAIGYSLLGATGVLPDSAGVVANHMVPVTLRWTASVGTIASYQLQISRNGATFVDAPVQPGLATTLTLPLAMGTSLAPRSYQFRIRGVNPNGVPSLWSTGAAMRLLPYDETNAAQRYVGVFTSLAQVGSYGGTVRSAAVAGARMDLGSTTASTIPGSIAWITTMGPDRGRASISIDRGVATVVDLYSPTPRTMAMPFVANLAVGAHAVTINVLGNRNPLSTGNRVDMDGLVILTSSTVVAPVTPGTLGGPIAAATPEDETLPIAVPANLEFAPIQPNPSRGAATLSIGLPRDGEVDLSIVDIQGRQVRSVHEGTMSAGMHQLTWDGRSSAGQLSAPGIYFAVLRFEDRTLTKRVIRIP